jgi:lipopolysaccharide transport system ATP-binding protein
MYVRLAFAVAAHLESEILIVDEVLAVGDAEFQKKCLGKMGDVSKGEGRTVLFVSHNLAAVNTLCNKGIVLDQGKLKYDGIVKGAMDYYVSTGNTSSNHYISEQQGDNDIWEIKVLNQEDKFTNNFYFNEEIKVRIQFKVVPENNENAEIGIRVTDQKERIVFTSQKPIELFEQNSHGIYNVDCAIPKNILVPNTYKILVATHIPNKKIISIIEDAVSFTIEETGTDFHMYNGVDYGCVFVDCMWK